MHGEGVGADGLMQRGEEDGRGWVRLREHTLSLGACCLRALLFIIVSLASPFITGVAFPTESATFALCYFALLL